MATDAQLQDAVEICLSILTRYRNRPKSQRTRELMEAEIAAIVGCLMELGLAVGETDERILKPVEHTLIARYGHEAGCRLNAEFVDAFEAIGMTLLARRGIWRGG